MRLSTALIFIIFSLLVLVQQVNAQSENCSTEPSLNYNDTFGFNVAPSPMGSDFAMTAPGCVDFSAAFYPVVCSSNSDYDNVVCFTPENNCDILINTSSGGGGSSINIFSGACKEPTSCITSAASSGPNFNSALIASVSLTAGTQYCVVWERCGSASHGLTINQITNCGQLGPLPGQGGTLPAIFLLLL